MERVRIEPGAETKPNGPIVLDVIHDYVWIGGSRKNDEWCIGTITRRADLRRLHEALGRILKPKRKRKPGGAK